MSILDDLKRIRDELDVIISGELDKPLETAQKVTESATKSKLIKDTDYSGFDGEGG